MNDFDTTLRKLITGEAPVANDLRLSAAIDRKARLAGKLDELLSPDAPPADLADVLDELRASTVALELLILTVAAARRSR